MTPQTLAEKLLSRAAGRSVRAGETVVCRPDLAFGTDGTIPQALDCLGRLDGGAPRAPYDARRLVFALGHCKAGSDPASIALHAQARQYAQQHDVTLYEIDVDIGSRHVLETGRALPGRVAVGTGSQAICCGAFNAFSTSIGATDLAGVMYCGQVWLRVPASIRVELSGRLPKDVSAMDLALHLVARLGTEGASYRALEFGGPGVDTLDMDDRIVLADMAVQTGAKAGLFRCDFKTRAYLAPRIGARTAAAQVGETPDAGARYLDMVSVDLDRVEPMVVLPGGHAAVVPLSAMAPTPIDIVCLGTCAAGCVKDYRQALAVLEQGGGVKPGIRLVVAPASEYVRDALESCGLLAEYLRLGAETPGPGCAVPWGMCTDVAHDGRRVVCAGGHPARARIDPPPTPIYLASPAECARAAVTGSLGGAPAKDFP